MLGVSVRAVRKYEDRHVRVRRELGRVFVSRADVMIVAARLGRTPTTPDDAALSRALAAGESADAIVVSLGVDYGRIASVADARDRLMGACSVPRAWLLAVARVAGASEVEAALPAPQALDLVLGLLRVALAESQAWRLEERRRERQEPKTAGKGPRTADNGTNSP